MIDEWWFIQSMTNMKQEREAKEEKLEELRAEIKEALHNKKLLKAQLDSIPRSERSKHPLRSAWIKAASMYWALIADMHEIENNKSATPKKL